MQHDSTIKLRVPTADLESWKRCAEKSGLTLSEWIRRRCNGEGHLLTNLRGIPAHVDDVTETTTGNLATIPRATPKNDKPKSKKSELAEAVAGRTHHAVGCACFQCVQAERFFKEQRKGE